MPNLDNAKKALRQSKKRQVLNIKRKKTIKDTWKSSNLSLIYKALDKAAKKGIIKKNKVARKKSQAARLNQFSAKNQSAIIPDK